MRKLLTSAVFIAGAVAAGGSSPAMPRAGKLVIAVVPKNLNNPFFDQAKLGCEKAVAEIGADKVECLFTGPPEHGGGDEQVQIVADLIAKGVDGIAVAAANAAAMASVMPAAKEAGIPVLTWDTDLLPEAKEFRVAYIGTHNYDIGVELAKLAQKIKPQGGTICIQSGGAAAANHNERMQGIRDTLAGVERGDPPGARLEGANGWTEVDGCPLYTNDDFPLSVQQLEDMLGKYPDLDAFIPTGGFPQFVPDAYRTAVSQYKDKIASGEARPRRRRHAAGSDRPDEGRPFGRSGRPAAVRDGLQGHLRHQGHEGRQAGAGRPDLYGPRRLHARQRRHLHRRLIAVGILGNEGGASAPPFHFGALTRSGGSRERRGYPAFVRPELPLDRLPRGAHTLRAGSLPHPPFVRPSGAPRRRAGSRRRRCLPSGRVLRRCGVRRAPRYPEDCSPPAPRRPAASLPRSAAAGSPR